MRILWSHGHSPQMYHSDLPAHVFLAQQQQWGVWNLICMRLRHEDSSDRIGGVPTALMARFTRAHFGYFNNLVPNWDCFCHVCGLTMLMFMHWWCFIEVNPPVLPEYFKFIAMAFVRFTYCRSMIKSVSSASKASRSRSSSSSAVNY